MNGAGVERVGGGLSTHVLDTALGRPARGVRVELFGIWGQERRALAEAVTNADGRTDIPLVARGELQAGTYELSFHVAPYFAAQPASQGDAPAADPPFLDVVTLRFTVADPAQHYHVPLLVTPWSYSTYRGS